MKQNFLIFIAAIIALSGGILLKNITQAKHPETIAEVQALLKQTQLVDTKGQQHTLSEWHGKILILNFWATWCPPCLKEVPDFVELQTQYQQQNLQFIGIAIEEKQSLIEHPLYAQINYPVLIAGNGGVSLSKKWGNLASIVPFSVVISPEGKIIHRQQGEFKREKILEIIKPLLNPAL